MLSSQQRLDNTLPSSYALKVEWFKWLLNVQEMNSLLIGLLHFKSTWPVSSEVLLSAYYNINIIYNRIRWKVKSVDSQKPTCPYLMLRAFVFNLLATSQVLRNFKLYLFILRRKSYRPKVFCILRKTYTLQNVCYCSRLSQL